MLTGHTRPTGGQACIGACDVLTDFGHNKPDINLVFENQNLYERLTSRDNLLLFAELYGQPAVRVMRLRVWRSGIVTNL